MFNQIIIFAYTLIMLNIELILDQGGFSMIVV